MKYFLICLSVICALNVTAQRKSKVKKNSIAKGTVFGFWGYNRSFYTQSDINFVGPGYDFTLRNSRAKDNPSTDIGTYFDVTRITVPQFNARIGYYIRNKYAISFGYDHMKYIFMDRNQVLLDGTIEPDVDVNWSGSYTNEPVVTNRDEFHYENSNGLNYLRFEVMRSDQLIRTNNKKFAVTWNNGIGIGSLLSYNDFTFGGRKDRVTISMSGYALSAHTALRFEFWNHFFFQTEASGGFMNQFKVRTRPNDRFAYAKHRYGYSMLSTTIGFLVYSKPKNSCDSCPNW